MPHFQAIIIMNHSGHMDAFWEFTCAGRFHVNKTPGVDKLSMTTSREVCWWNQHHMLANLLWWAIIGKNSFVHCIFPKNNRHPWFRGPLDTFSKPWSMGPLDTFSKLHILKVWQSGYFEYLPSSPSLHPLLTTTTCQSVETWITYLSFKVPDSNIFNPSAIQDLCLYEYYSHNKDLMSLNLSKRLLNPVIILMRFV